MTLYWRALRDGERDDWTFFAHLVDDAGFRWGGETFFHYPSAQWREGDVMLFRKRVPIAPGAPPDDEYALDVGLSSPSLDARLPVLNESGQMAGTTARVGPLAVGRAAAPPAELPPTPPTAMTVGASLEAEEEIPDWLRELEAAEATPVEERLHRSLRRRHPPRQKQTSPIGYPICDRKPPRHWR